MTEKSKARSKLSKVFHLLTMSRLKPEKQEETPIENIMDVDEKKEESAEKSSSDEKKAKMVQKKCETVEKSSGERKAKKDQKKYETAEKSSSYERKAKKVQGKYGAAPEAAIEQKRDAEEFENVNATVRPAQPKMRTATLRWKSGEQEDTIDDSFEQLSAEAVTNSPSVQPGAERKSPSSSAEAKTQTADRVNAIRQKSEKERTLADIPILLKRIAELESAQSKSIMTQKRLRLRLRDKERTIRELTDALNAPSPAVKTIDEEEKLSKHDEKIAKRALEVIRKEQLLEKALVYREMKLLSQYFDAPETKPDQRVAMVLDKALGFAIDVLLNRRQSKDAFVDNEMKLFLLKKIKAKRALLAVMLRNPEYIPECWGGERAHRSPRSPIVRTVDTMEGESEKTILKTTRQVLGYIFDTQAKQSDECAVEIERPSLETKKEKKKSGSSEGGTAETRRKKSKTQRERR